MAMPVSSRTAGFVSALIVGFGVFAVACLGDTVMLVMGGSPWLGVIDDICIGSFAAAIVLYYERRRTRDLRRKLTTVAQMNHHVRNQLEIIEFSAWTTHNKAHIARMHEAVAHIDWALREVLGKRYIDAVPPPAKPPRPSHYSVMDQRHESAD
jgi:hypothetical protein